jgi:creatinine amidohydrolase
MKNNFILLIFITVVFSSSCKDSRKQNLVDKSIFAGTMVEMNWLDIKKAAIPGTVILLPVAVIEEHGPHLDLSPDVYLTLIPCKLIKTELEKKGIKCLIAPPFYWGIDSVTKQFPGSFNVKPSTFLALIKDIAENLDSWGFKHIYCVNLHGDDSHLGNLKIATNKIRNDLKIEIYDVSTLPVPEIVPPRPEFSDKLQNDFHAGANETSAMWYYLPDKVDVEKALTLPPQLKFEPLGYCGAPALFKTDGKGKEIIEFIARYSANQIIDHLKTYSPK